MLVDGNGEFITARKFPRLLCIRPELDQETGELSLHIPKLPVLTIPPAAQNGETLKVKIWDDQVEAIHVDINVDNALSQYLGINCKMVFIDDKTVRSVDQNYATPSDRTGFSDGFPLLLISKESLEDLNSRMDKELPMKRFRPNIVVEGCSPYDEDNWKQFSTATVTLSAVKPCSRCIMTTANPETGEREGKEPLRTLKTYRLKGNNVMFGQNVIHQNQGMLRKGETLTIVDPS